MNGQEYFEMLDTSITDTYWLILYFTYLFALMAIFKMSEAPVAKALFYVAVGISLASNIHFHHVYKFIAPIEIELILISPIIIYGCILMVSRYIWKDLKAKALTEDNNGEDSIALREPFTVNSTIFIVINIAAFVLWIATVAAYHQIIRPALKSMFVP